MKLSLIIASLLLPIAAHASVTNLVKNGSFENPNLKTGSWAVFESINGWKTSSGAGIEIQDHVAGSPKFGNQFVELDSDNNSSMYQKLNTVVGQLYTLSFWYSARPGTSAATNGLHIKFGDVFASINPGKGGNDTNWLYWHETFTATSNHTLLSFAALGNSDSYGTYLDNVSVTAVPEPETYALMGLGLAGLLVSRRRKHTA